jgi:hypothetical protein
MLVYVALLGYGWSRSITFGSYVTNFKPVQCSSHNGMHHSTVTSQVWHPNSGTDITYTLNSFYQYILYLFIFSDGISLFLF